MAVLPQRKAREAVTLSNGIHVPKGTHFAFPLGRRHAQLQPIPEPGAVRRLALLPPAGRGKVDREQQHVPGDDA